MSELQGSFLSSCLSSSSDSNSLLLLQLVMFGLSNQVVVTFKEENTMTFKHLFLKDYDESSDASFAVYTQKDVYEHIFYAVDQVWKRAEPLFD